MAGLILFNKPFQVLSQFSASADKRTLADYIDAPGYYPAGRLDYDSEGLLLLTDDGALQARIAAPRHKMWKRYLLQVEGTPNEAALERLRHGVELSDGPTRPARARLAASPEVWPREPPIRQRASIEVSWLELELQEGRNRQARRMSAAIGCPTLRLIRTAIGDWSLDKLQPGQYRHVKVNLPRAGTGRKPRSRAR